MESCCGEMSRFDSAIPRNDSYGNLLVGCDRGCRRHLCCERRENDSLNYEAGWCRGNPRSCFRLSFTSSYPEQDELRRTVWTTIRVDSRYRFLIPRPLAALRASLIAVLAVALHFFRGIYRARERMDIAFRSDLR